MEVARDAGAFLFESQFAEVAFCEYELPAPKERHPEGERRRSGEKYREPIAVVGSARDQPAGAFSQDPSRS